MKSGLCFLAFGLLIAFYGMSDAAYAQTCFGVEMRVNSRTMVLQGAIEGSIDTVEAALIAEETRQRAQLVSAIRVLTSQSSVSNDQTTAATAKSTEASAAAIISQNYNQAVADATHKYSSTGYNACGAIQKTTDVYNAIQKSASDRQQIAASITWKAGQYGDPAQWTQAVRSGSSFDGASLYSGDKVAAAAFINVIVGPPDKLNPTIQGTAENDQFRLNKAYADAHKSVAATALSDIAADYATDGPVAKMRELTTHWIGSDGGEQWAASLATQHERGILQDAVRMEAANVALLAQQVKKGVRNEMTVASLLLEIVNAKIKDSNAAKQPLAKKASLQ